MPLEVSYVGQDAIDIGGVRRDFLTNLILQLPSQLSLFEGDYATGVLPSIGHEAVMAGHFKMFGRVLVHSILQEGPAFPFFPRSVFRYLCTRALDEALPYLSVEDLPYAPKAVVGQVSLG